MRRDIKIRRVVFPHYLTSGEDDHELRKSRWQKRVPVSAKRIAYRVMRNQASEAFMATSRGKIVGFLRYEMTQAGAVAHGTWVSVPMRGRGLSKRLWNRLADRVGKGGHIEVATVSPGGWALVESVRRDRPDIRIRHICI